ncbi:MAG: glycosyltransferase family 39 protein [Pyrinomonadaceae bacterium]
MRAYASELHFAAFVQAVNFANLLLMAWALPQETIDRLKRYLDNSFGQVSAGKIDRYAVCAAVWVTLLASALSFFIYERHPHVPDEVSYLAQAKYFAEVMLTMPVPAVPDAFKVDIMTYEANRWYSPFPPGWPAVLSLGVPLGATWLINPILAGLNIFAVFSLMRELYDRRSARIAVLLLSASPWYIFMAMNYMAHTFTLTCGLAAALALIRARHTDRARWAVLSGAAVGVTSLVRPLDGFILAVLLGLWAIGVGGRRVKASALLCFTFGSLLIGSINLLYNKALTGSFTYFPVNAYFDKYYGVGSNALGFGPGRGVGWALDAYPGHNLFEALINANLNIFSINIELFGWSTGALFLCAVAILSGKLITSDRLMIVAALVVAGMYSLYWFSGGPDFGARYWYFVIIPCLALSVSGIRLLERKLCNTYAHLSVSKDRVVTAVAILCLCSLINYFPWRAVDKYHHYLGMRPDLRRLAVDFNFGKSLILIRGKQYPDYASAAAYNPPDLRGNVPIFVWDRDPDIRAEVLRAYSDRPVWIVNGPSLTHSGFKVHQGPLSAGNLLSEQAYIR